ncbi:hypothetical protein AB0C77_21815 [Streptomyces sp. NPDC048629]|uniref:hypothetical protein n=1 Tax=Streptomyces sp. NPDC048629 TaxID=3154824 RepID=UPI00341D124F
MWSHQITGAGGPSYEISRLPDVVLIKLCAAVGLGAPVAQVVLYALILGAAAAGTSFLASCWLRRPVAAAAAGVLSVANVYVLVTLLNPLPALAGALTAFLGGQLVRAAQGRKVRPRTVALTTLPLCYLGMNPPLLAIVFIGVAVLGAVGALSAPGRARSVLRLALRAAPLVIGLQLWWLVPQLITLQGGSSATVFSAQTNAAAWAWTQARNTLTNIVTLNAHWGWTYSEYYPFARAMDSWPWAALRWVPPLLALAGAAFPPGPPRTRRALRVLGGSCVVLVLLCKGLHPPLAGLNDWLYTYVPGMWMFREPMSKFGVLLVLLVSLLAGAAVERVLDRVVPMRGAVRRGLRAATAAVVLGAVAYPAPLWTGALVEQDRDPLPAASVRVPAAWHHVAERANASKAPGKVLELPLQNYYQVLTRWGYHGTDSVPQQLLTRPLLQRLPGGYFDASPQLADLLALAEESLERGDTGAALGALRALDVDQVVVRRDLVITDDEIASPDRLGRTLARMNGVRRTAATEVADLYELPAAPSRGGRLVLNRPVEAGVTARAAAQGAATTADSSAPVDSAHLTVSGDTTQDLVLRRAGTYRIGVDRGTSTSYRPRYLADGTPQVELTDAHRVRVDGDDLPTAPGMRIFLDEGTEGPPAALLVDGSVLPWQADTPVAVSPGDEVGVAVPDGSGELMSEWSRQGNGSCSRLGADRRLDRRSGGSWAVTARTGTTCLRMPLEGVPDSGLVSVSLRYRSLGAGSPRVCLWQNGPDSCAVSRTLPADRAWRTWHAVVRLDPGTDSAALYAYADGLPGAGMPTVAEYADAHAAALTVAGSAEAPEVPSATVEGSAQAGRHRIEVRQTGGTAQPALFGGLGDCARRDDRGFRAAGLAARHLGPGSVQLRANAHTACVAAVVAAADPGPDRAEDPAEGRLTGSYRLSLRYRTLSGSPARMCLWQDGPDRCADLPPLADSTGWTTFDTRVTPRPGTRQLALYLYADGDDAGTTRVEYTDVRVARTPDPLTVSITPAAPATAPAEPAAQVRRLGAGHQRITLTDLRGSTVVALRDSFHAQWRLSGLPAGWTARALEVDGYRQAWVVSGHGDAVLDAGFGPDRWWFAAVAASLLCLLRTTLPARPRRRPAPTSPSIPPILPPRLSESGDDADAVPRQKPADLGGDSRQEQCATGDPTARLAGRAGLRGGGSRSER